MAYTGVRAVIICFATLLQQHTPLQLSTLYLQCAVTALTMTTLAATTVDTCWHRIRQSRQTVLSACVQRGGEV